MRAYFLSLLVFCGVLQTGSAAPWHAVDPRWKSRIGETENAETSDADDSAWPVVDASRPDPAAGDGSVQWLRKPLMLPPDCLGHTLLLHLGIPYPWAEVYCNGVKVAGGRDGRGRPVVILPALLIRAGESNVIAVKLTMPADVAPLSQPEWTPLDAELPDIFAAAKTAQTRLDARCVGLAPATLHFLFAGLQAGDFDRLQQAYAKNHADPLAADVAARWRELCEAEAALDRRLLDTEHLRSGNRLLFMQDEELYHVRDFTCDAPRRPTLGSEFSDFGSWYDIAYSGGPGRFFLGSVRAGVGPDNEFFNTPRDVGQFALFLDTGGGLLVGADDSASAVTWWPYGWSTRTSSDGIELVASTFFSGFNTITVHGRVNNTGAHPRTIRPALLATMHASYEKSPGGEVAGRIEPEGLVTLRNTRTGPRTSPSLYSDTVAIGTDTGSLEVSFATRQFPSARGSELATAAQLGSGESSFAAPEGSAVVRSRAFTLAPGGSAEFSFTLVAAAETADAVRAVRTVATAKPAEVLARVRQDWSDFLAALPALDDPSYEKTKLYFSSAIALRKNRWLRPQDGRLYSASFPARGGFNYFYQSDSCWNLLGYLDFNPAWARGHAVPILVPTCEIMDPHFFWSMWELYSRLPEPADRRAFAEEIYPLLAEAYRHWTTKLDTDGDLLVATPNNWDDNPRYDLIFKEVKYAPGWNSWWDDLVACCRDHQLDDPAPSSQLGYGAVTLERFARILGRTDEAESWRRLIPSHRKAVDSLWDPKLGYWIVTYRGKLRDAVLTSSIVYPIFTGLCSDPEKIRTVVQQHLLNPAEFAGQFPVPTIAYNDPRFYHQKPPFEREPGGLWRGNIWMPETWIIVKGLFKYGYEREADAFAEKLVAMQARQSGSVGRWQTLRHSPAEWYDARTGLAQNNRAFSWSSAVALDYLLGNYQNERVLGSDPVRDRSVHGHVRELFDFASGRSLLRIESPKTVFPLLDLSSEDNEPIDRSNQVSLLLSDPAGNFGGNPVRCFADPTKWQLCDESGTPLKCDPDGSCPAPFGRKLQLRPVKP